MQDGLLDILRCPITGSKFTIQLIRKGKKVYAGIETEIISEAILWTENGLFYPVVGAIPRLIPEATIDYRNFLQENIPDFSERIKNIKKEYIDLINACAEKNRRTKESFALEWKIFNYEKDKTWDDDVTAMRERFLTETDETAESIKGKLIFDVGCGNGMLDSLLAKNGAIILGMDLSLSIEKAYEINEAKNAFFIQGDVQFPPVQKKSFDIVQCSGILIHTDNTANSFATIETCVKGNGKLSVWLYHPRKNFIHNLFNKIRNRTSKLPLKLQYYIYSFTLFPASYVIKRLKGNKQNPREMMVNILDWFTPQYRWEHEHNEVAGWFADKNYHSVKITKDELFGFNIVGIKEGNHTRN